MTIKGDEINTSNNDNKTHGAAEAENIPVAFASVLDEKPPATATGYSVAGDTAGYEPTATPTPPQQPTSSTQTSNAAVPSATVVQGSNVPSSTTKPTGFGQRPIPPGAPPGGNWVRYQFTGKKTWGIIGATACGLFWCCAIVLAPCALWGLMCPCDEREGYMSPRGVIYDEMGKAQGDRRRNKYKVISQA